MKLVLLHKTFKYIIRWKFKQKINNLNGKKGLYDLTSRETMKQTIILKKLWVKWSI